MQVKIDKRSGITTIVMTEQERRQFMSSLNSVKTVWAAIQSAMAKMGMV